MTHYGPIIKAARHYERRSKNGNIYLVGRGGPLRIAVPSKHTGENGEPHWQLLLSEAPPKADSSDCDKKRQPIVELEGTPKAAPDAACCLDDPIPF
jgi:hypothetical protein